MATHPKCGKTWTGHRAEHCPACCETFTGHAAGDAHRVGSWADGTRRCLTPAEMAERGLTVNHRGLWGLPGGDSLSRWLEGLKSPTPEVEP